MTEEQQPRPPVHHNHMTRDIKAPGICPACDRYHATHPHPAIHHTGDRPMSKRSDSQILDYIVVGVLIFIIIVLGIAIGSTYATCDQDYNCTPPTTEEPTTTWPDTTSPTTDYTVPPSSSTTEPVSTTSVSTSTPSSTATTSPAPSSTSSTMAPSTTGAPTSSTTVTPTTSISWATSAPTTSVAVAPPPTPTRNLPNTGTEVWQLVVTAIALLSVGGLCVYITREQSEASPSDGSPS